MNSRNLEFIDHLNRLLALSFEGLITESQFYELTKILKENTAARDYYYDFIAFYVGVNELKILSEIEHCKEQLDTQQLWAELLEEESTAPAVEIPKEKIKPEPIQKVVYKKVPYKFPTASVITAITSMAALLLLFAYVYISPRNTSSPVAIIMDAIDAAWQDSTEKVGSGQRLYSDKPLILKKGIIKIEFDYGARIVVEGPAEIELLSESHMTLDFGRLYANVPEQASGFIIDTPTSRIVDLGTEFGVRVHSAGTSDIYMSDGQASLIPGTDRQKQKGFNLVAGQAKSVNIYGRSEDIKFEKTAFVKDIDSSKNFVWHGQNFVDLADIAGGGNGFGTGKIGYGVSMTSGKIELFENLNEEKISPISVKHKQLFYNRVADSPFIDGVFLPDGGMGKVIVSSQGHVFKECPDTVGKTNRPAMNGGDKVFSINRVYCPMMIDGQVCGTKEYPALCMVSNSGMTYDLQAIRDSLQGLELTAFKAESAISTNVSKTMGYASVYVLIDGKLRYFDKDVKRQPEDINIPIKPGDRFLTLITTDNGRIYNDWILYGRPRLELKQ